MPLSKYFGGHGKKVMADMKARYGSEKGKKVFYATANKQGQTHNSLGDSDPIHGPGPLIAGYVKSGDHGRSEPPDAAPNID